MLININSTLMLQDSEKWTLGTRIEEGLYEPECIYSGINFLEKRARLLSSRKDCMLSDMLLEHTTSVEHEHVRGLGERQRECAK